MLSWLHAVALAAAMAAVAVGTSYFWLRIARLPGYVAAVLAPAVTAGLLLPIGHFYYRLNIFWAGTTVLPLLAAIGLAGAVLYLRQSRRRPASPTSPKPFRTGPAFWFLVAAGWLLGAVPLFMAGPATNPVQQWDPSFHMNGVWSINQIGDGRYGSALGALFAAGSASSYPSGWHAFTALFTSPHTALIGANASTLAVILLWVVGAAAYTRAIFQVRTATLIVALLAGGMLSMPADALMAYNQWPNASAVALLPGIGAALVLWGRAFTSWWTGEGNQRPAVLAAGLAVILLAVGGALSVHPSAAFNLLILMGPAIFAGGYRLVSYWLLSGSPRRAALTGLFLFAGAAVSCAVFFLPPVRSMGRYPRPGVSTEAAFVSIVLPTPPYPGTLSLFTSAAVLTLLVLAGIIATYGRSRTWPGGEKVLPTWPVWSYALFAAFTFLAFSAFESWREFLIAPWFLDTRRVMEPASLAIVTLAGLGFAWAVHLLQALRDRWSLRWPNWFAAAFLGLSVFLFSSAMGLEARIGAARTVLDPTQLGKPGMATAAELDMLYRLDELLPAEAIVLGDPQNGAVYTQVIGQRRAYFPALTLSRNPAPNEQTLRERFNQIHADPAVCDAVREEGITHFYADEDGYYYSRLRSERTPGLYGVDTSIGFELIAEGDTARVYEITACD